MMVGEYRSNVWCDKKVSAVTITAQKEVEYAINYCTFSSVIVSVCILH